MTTTAVMIQAQVLFCINTYVLIFYVKDIIFDKIIKNLSLIIFEILQNDNC